MQNTGLPILLLTQMLLLEFYQKKKKCFFSFSSFLQILFESFAIFTARYYTLTIKPLC